MVIRPAQESGEIGAQGNCARAAPEGRAGLRRNAAAFVARRRDALNTGPRQYARACVGYHGRRRKTCAPKPLLGCWENRDRRGKGEGTFAENPGKDG